MPVSEGINLALMLSESGIIDNAVQELMLQQQIIVAAESNPGIKSAMKKQIMKWRGQVQKRMTNVSVEERFHQEIELYQQACQWESEDFLNHIDEVVKQLEGHSAFYFKAKTLLEREHQKHNPMFQSYFCSQWHKYLTLALTEAQQIELEQHKEKLLADLYQRIETMQHMEEVTGAGDPTKAGRLWDMAKAKLTKTDVSTLKSMAHFLKKNSGLKEIAEKLGRMANEVDDPNKERVRSED